MKKTLLTLLMGSSAISLCADETKCEISSLPLSSLEKFILSHHEINPNFRVLRHEEPNYSYTKAIGGMEYRYYRSEGLNFGTFMGYSYSNDKSFFLAEWDLKYLFNCTDTINCYPIIGISNTSHFSSSNLGDNYQIYCHKFNGGFAATYNYDETVTIDAGIHYFKDLSTSVVLCRGNDFWGKRYHSPYGLKGTVDLKFPHILSKDIIIGGFYAQTIKECYKEFGLNLTVAFAF